MKITGKVFAEKSQIKIVVQLLPNNNSGLPGLFQTRGDPTGSAFSGVICTNLRVTKFF